jgi:predicted 3-demethylubiquinone-9 3-methyltransferase (glyoxalase superfamily)
MPDLKPALWFRSEAEDAASFYVSLFPNSSIGNVMRGAPGTPAIAVEFVLDGLGFLALNGRSEQGFTDAHSFLVPCADQAEIDRYWNALTEGGEEGQCGWLKDRFGVSWQIAPRAFGSLLGGPDGAASGRAMQAMMKMRKIDIATIERAKAGDA